MTEATTDVTNEEAKPERKKVERTPEQIAARRAAKILAYQNWKQVWATSNPKASKDDQKAAWKTASAGEMRKARKTIKVLEKGGFKLVQAEA